jgi:hypothetical protein
MDKLVKSLAVALGLMAGALGIGLLFSYPLMLLWNGCVVPAVSVVNEVTWLQMWGIFIISDVLFKTSVSKKD